MATKQPCQKATVPVPTPGGGPVAGSAACGPKPPCGSQSTALGHVAADADGSAPFVPLVPVTTMDVFLRHAYPPGDSVATRAAAAGAGGGAPAPPRLGAPVCSVNTSKPAFSINIDPGNSSQQAINQAISLVTTTSTSASCVQQSTNLNFVSAVQCAFCGGCTCLEALYGSTTGQGPTLTCDTSQSTKATQAAAQAALNKLLQSAGPVGIQSNTSTQCISQALDEAVQSASTASCDQLSTDVNDVSVCYSAYGLSPTEFAFAQLFGTTQSCFSAVSANNAPANVSCAIHQAVSVTQSASQSGSNAATQKNSTGLASIIGSIAALIIVVVILVAIIKATSKGRHKHHHKHAGAVPIFDEDSDSESGDSVSSDSD